MDQLILNNGEEILVSTRTHWKNTVLPLVLASPFAAFDILRLQGTPPLFDLTFLTGTPIGWIDAVLAAIVTVTLAFGAIGNIFQMYTVTNERLVLRQGLLSTRTTELQLRYCSNLMMTQSLLGKILGYGDFKLRSGGVDIFFNDVPEPKEFKRILSAAIDKASMFEVPSK